MKNKYPVDLKFWVCLMALVIGFGVGMVLWNVYFKHR